MTLSDKISSDLIPLADRYMAAYKQAMSELEPQYANQWTIATSLSYMPDDAVDTRAQEILGSDYSLCRAAHVYRDEYMIRFNDNRPEDL